MRVPPDLDDHRDAHANTHQHVEHGDADAHTNLDSATRGDSDAHPRHGRFALSILVQLLRGQLRARIESCCSRYHHATAQVLGRGDADTRRCSWSYADADPWYDGLSIPVLLPMVY